MDTPVASAPAAPPVRQRSPPAPASPSTPESPNSPASIGNYDAAAAAAAAHHLVLVGGGPRSVIQVNAEVLFMILFRDHFSELAALGAQYRLSTTILEKQPAIALGSPYGAGQTGMMNTGLEDDVRFPLPLPPHAAALSVLNHFLSYKQRYENYVGRDVHAYHREVKKYNLPGAVMFKKSVGPESFSADGALDHTIAYLLRRTTGAEEAATFAIVRSLADRLLPFYTLTVRPSCEVSHVKLSPATKPLVLARAAADAAAPLALEADLVRLNTGTILQTPVADVRVHARMFCQPMNVEHFREHCQRRALLGADGLLRPGLAVISGGMGLSGLDQLAVLDGVMHLFEEDDASLLGYRVTEDAKRRYQGAITLISRTAGRSVLPRQGFTPEWRQRVPGVATTEHLHALALHGHGEELFRVWYDVMTASVARTMGKTPEAVRQGKLSTEASLKLQFEETLKFLHFRRLAGDQEKEGNMAKKEELLNESMRTIYGAWRQAASAFLFGYGFENNINAATTRMEKLAPITWKGRQSWMYARMMVNAITDPEFALKQSNIEVYHIWKDIYRYLASSPVEIHSMLHLLLDAGIAQYRHAEYNKVTFDEATGKIDLFGKLHDLFIVSPTYETSEDIVCSKVSQQLKPYVAEHPSYGSIGKFRRFQDKLGRPVPIESNGVAGLGFDVHDHGFHSKVGTFGIDLNDRSSGAGVASSFTLRRMAVAHMRAAGIESAEEKIDELYELGKPSIEAYENEVKTFERFFVEACEIRAYLKAIEAIAGDDALAFCEMYDKGLTEDGRKEQMQKYGSETYEQEVANMPQFKAPSRDAYLARSVDTTDEEDVWLYTEAFKLAKKHLKMTSN